MMPLFVNQQFGDASFISFETLANPPQNLIDNMSGVYITTDGARYQSDGNALYGITSAQIASMQELLYGNALSQVDIRTKVLADNFTDNKTVIQNALYAAQALKNNFQSVAGNIPVLIPPGRIKSSNFVIPDGVVLIGYRSNLIAIENGTFITLGGSGSITNCALSGQYDAIQSEGILMSETSNGARVEEVKLDGFYGRGLVDRGYANVLDRVTAINVLYSQANILTSYAGGIELSGADGWCTRCEVSTRGALGLSATAYAAGLMVNGPNYMVNDVIGETSDSGVVITANATQLKMDGVRGELSYGHGWIITGGNGRITNPSALRNGRQANATYDGWHCDGAAMFQVTNLWVYGNDTGNRENYGLYDGNFSASQYCTYLDPYVINTFNAVYTQNVSGTKIHITDGPIVGIAGSTPNIRLNRVFQAANSSPVTINSFAQSYSGQRILIRGDGFMTIPNNANFVMLSGANTLLANGVWYELIRSGAVWYQIK